MNYRESKNKQVVNSATCQECNSKSVLFKGGSIICRDCDHVIFSPKTRKNKYNAIKTVAKDGLKRDSKFEASVADELYMRKVAKDIQDYESQYKVLLNIYDNQGNVVMTKNWKVDFRILHNDGSYELLEAKGVEGDDYKWKRDILTNVWLPEHPDHIYTVQKQQRYGKKSYTK